MLLGRISEFALSKDLMVSLWTQYQAFTGNEPLREVYDGDFVMVDNDLYGDFKEFKKSGETFESLSIGTDCTRRN